MKDRYKELTGKDPYVADGEKASFTDDYVDWLQDMLSVRGCLSLSSAKDLIDTEKFAEAVANPPTSTMATTSNLPYDTKEMLMKGFEEAIKYFKDAEEKFKKDRAEVKTVLFRTAKTGHYDIVVIPKRHSDRCAQLVESLDNYFPLKLEIPKIRTTFDRAAEWRRSGDTGLSSDAMYYLFMNIGQYPIYTRRRDHPSDPEDFGRCLGLLRAVPEWKDRICELRALSQAWANLVDNWDKLTEMYERNIAEGWKNVDDIGMYEYMQSLTEE